MRPWLVGVAMFGMFGCGDDGQRPVDAPAADTAIDAAIDAPVVDPHVIVAEVPATANHDLDLLFVIDDSNSMADKQANLVANFPNFINVLNTLPGGLPNLHLGVITTDMGTKGSEVATPGAPIGQLGQGGCSGTGKGGNLQINGAPVTGLFISDIKAGDGSRIKNYTGNLADAFGTMARVGSAGCGFEQPLSAMRAALENTTANAGFLRPSALLGVVFLTDEDDCSIKTPTMFGPEDATIGPLQSFRCTRFGVTCTGGGATSDQMNTPGAKTGCSGSIGSMYMTDVAPFHQFLIGLKGDARLVVVGGIAGPAAPVATELRAPSGTMTAIPALAHSCTYQSTTGLEVADPGVRLDQFFGMFPDASFASTICQQDLSGALDAAGTLLTRRIGSPCIPIPLADVDPNTPGTQIDCVVEDHVGSTVTPMPPCSSGAPTCWSLHADLANCPVADHLSVTLTRPAAPDPATVTVVRCIPQ